MSAMAFCFALAGFAALALAMPRHYQAVLRKHQPRRIGRGLRMAGWAMIATSLVPAMLWMGVGVGMVAWFGVLNAAALFVALGLTSAKAALK